MNDWLSGGGATLRLTVFLATLLLMLLLERLAPRRMTPPQRRLRWSANFGLVVIDSILLRLLLPLAALGMAVLAQQRGWGLLNLVPLPPWLSVPLAWLLLDCAIYWQHRAMHAVPLLWRLHRVHHTDIEFDTTTALRFHPVEILLSMLFKMTTVTALGAPPLAVLLFEIALNAAALFNHANIRLPGDRWLRRLLVTPDMHRVHHSVHRIETDSNYGNVLAVWDYAFRSYTPQPRDGHLEMRIGLYEFRVEAEQRLGPLLLNPALRQ
jgi:sterol desaturase/sphingolipid hydroxylase (fatty acid hydroxylase superfamily)